MAAAVTLLGTQTFNTTSGTHTVTATPAVGDLIVIVVANTGSTSSVAPTDNNSGGGGTYTLITSAVKNTSADTMRVYVRNALITSATSTVFTQAPGTTTGGGLAVLKVTGMPTAGIEAVRQSAKQDNQAAAGTPTPVFSNAPLTVNPVIGALFNATNPSALTERGGYNERVDTGYSTPTTGLEIMTRNSGETNTSIAWGNISASAFCSIAVELAFNIAPTIALSTGNDGTADFQDNFNDNSIDATLYNNWGGVKVVETNGQLQLSSNTTATYYGIDVLGTKNLTGKYISVEVVSVGNQAITSWEAYPLSLFVDTNNKVEFRIAGGTIYASKWVSGVQTDLASATYSSTTHRYVRIREASGSTYWEYSADRVSWNELTHAGNPITVTALTVEFIVGQWQVEASTTTMILDNVNIVEPYSFGSDTTPTLEFTGTDTESDDLRYQVQIGTVSTVLPVIDSYSETNSNTTNFLGASNSSIGQSFTGNGNTLAAARFYLSRAANAKGFIRAKVYAHTGTFGTSSARTGSAIATSDDISVSTLSTSLGLIEFTFTGANKITLTNGTKYVIEVEYLESFDVEIGQDSTSPTHGGNATTNGSASASLDTIFYVLSTPTLDKISNADSGFANTVNGVDTDPFTSGQKVSFTVQAGDALSTGTYYWRARAIDPSGSTIYSAWSTIRSFTISTGVTNTTNFFQFF